MQIKPRDSERAPALGLSDSVLRRIFVGNQGIRAGWSALLFVAIFVILLSIVRAVIRHFVALEHGGPEQAHLLLLQEACGVLVVSIATFVMSRIERRPPLAYGYLGHHRVTRLMSGMGWGLLCLSSLVGMLWKLGFLTFDGFLLSGLSAWKYALAWGCVFLLVGIFEELLLRGYLQSTLSRGIGFWWAALLLSVLFALGHASNGGESALGLAEVWVGGLFFCLSLWYTKSLWWAVGFHAGWDWAESYLYGTPDSGLLAQGRLMSTHPQGNPLWSGGTAGPEGSLLVLPLMILMAVGMRIWWGERKKRSSPKLSV